MPKFPLNLLQANINKARDLHKNGQPQLARTLAKEILRNDQENIAAQEILALVEMEHGDIGRSIKMLRRIVARQPKNPIFRYNLAVAQRYAGQMERAAEGFTKALTIDPKFDPARVELLVVLANLGWFEQAEALSREMIAKDPMHAQGWHFLAFDRASSVTPNDIALLRDVLADCRMSGTRASLLFAYAEMLRKTGDHKASFAALKEGNDLTFADLSAGPKPTTAIAPTSELARRNTPKQAEDQHQRICDFVTRIFDANFFSQFAESDVPKRNHIFITGMPRSGSTLIEQILSSHPDVFGAGEVDDLNRTLINSWPFAGPKTDAGPPKTSADLPAKHSDHFRQLGLAYHDLMKAHAPDARYYTNKMLGNYLFIGMIHMILPGATIIDARRDPIDNCFACYQRHFRSGHEFTYDLAALGRQYRRYDAVMEHWDQVLPGRVIKVQYEDMVNDPEPQMRRLLEACKLPWSDDVLRFYENTRGVRTASQSQVKQPIQRTSVGKWRPHSEHLGPLFTALGLAHCTP